MSIKYLVIIFCLYQSLFGQVPKDVLLGENSIVHKNQTIQQSFYICSKSDNTASNCYSAINLAGQLVVGSSLQVVFAFLPAGTAFALAFGGKETAITNTLLGTLTLSSYIFGAAVGVYWIGTIENKNLSLWKTFGFAAIGGGVGIIIALILATRSKNIPAVGGVIAAICPVLGAMTYASLIAEWPKSSSKATLNSVSLSHIDLFENSKLFNIEFLRIDL